MSICKIYRGLFICLLAVLNCANLAAQSDYYPPADDEPWEVLSPESLGWNVDKLDELTDWLGENGTLAFIILKDGKLVVEQYYGLFDRDQEWYWASAGKTVTAMLIGALEKQGLLDIHQPTSEYLGTGWTSLTAAQEEQITPWHQLTMTTGLDYETDDLNCTLPACLQYGADVGQQWYYHNAPYTLLTDVAEAAADASLQELTGALNESVPGMHLRYVQGGMSPFNKVVVSKPLDMARFGLLVSRGTVWNENEPILNETFLTDMLTPSQQLNPSYGYLWWLNGQDSFIPPGLDITIPGELTPEAPSDMVSAIGLNSQILSIVPSRGLIIVRMGNNPGTLFGFMNQKWERLNQVLETETSAEMEKPSGFYLDQNYPNPFNPSTEITYSLSNPSHVLLDVYDLSGRRVSILVDEHKQAGTLRVRFDANGLSSGPYFYRLQTADGAISRMMLLVR